MLRATEMLPVVVTPLAMEICVLNAMQLAMGITPALVTINVMGTQLVRATMSVIVRDVNLIPATVSVSATVIQRVPVTIHAMAMWPVPVTRPAMLILVIPATRLVMDTRPVAVMIRAMKKFRVLVIGLATETDRRDYDNRNI